uniref:36.4 kDa proline-rich protein-like n=1 Tax=Phascolarctos cinereus TaxID=38626 RepID=A0A6P5LG82_PHACI|nr:36.4 kDa proline-rich protein-like [Phascolarctos cinereus]
MNGAARLSDGSPPPLARSQALPPPPLSSSCLRLPFFSLLPLHRHLAASAPLPALLPLGLVGRRWPQPPFGHPATPFFVSLASVLPALPPLPAFPQSPFIVPCLACPRSLPPSLWRGAPASPSPALHHPPSLPHPVFLDWDFCSLPCPIHPHPSAAFSVGIWERAGVPALRGLLQTGSEVIWSIPLPSSCASPGQNWFLRVLQSERNSKQVSRRILKLVASGRGQAH